MDYTLHKNKIIENRSYGVPDYQNINNVYSVEILTEKLKNHEQLTNNPTVLKIRDNCLAFLGENNFTHFGGEMFQLGYQTALADLEKYQDVIIKFLIIKYSPKHSSKEYANNCNIIADFIKANIKMLKGKNVDPRSSNHIFDLIYSTIGSKLRTGKKQLRKSNLTDKRGDYYKFIIDLRDTL